MLTSEQVMDAYVAAWNIVEPETRHLQLKQALTEDAVITYPTLEAQGLEGISAAMGAVQQQLPGVRFVQTSGIEEHHGWLRAAWRMIEADGSVRLAGEDVAEVADDGRLRRVVGFHDPLPPLSRP